MKLLMLSLTLLWAMGCTNNGQNPTMDAGVRMGDGSPPSEPNRDGSAPAVDGAVSIPTHSIHFQAMVGSESANCSGSYTGFGPKHDQAFHFADLRFYVHSIELIADDGKSVPVEIVDESPWQRAGVALLDFEDHSHGCNNGTSETRTFVTTTAPSGNYSKIRFVLGVPFALNHQDRSSAEPPLAFSSLFWNWQSGYIFFRADLVTENTAPPSSFFVHLGSTGCDGNPLGNVTHCEQPNLATIELAHFDPEHSAVVLDVGELIGSTDLTFNTPGTAAGCMSALNDSECSQIFASFGLPFGTTTPKMETAFHVGTYP